MKQSNTKLSLRVRVGGGGGGGHVLSSLTRGCVGGIKLLSKSLLLLDVTMKVIDILKIVGKFPVDDYLIILRLHRSIYPGSFLC